MNEDQPPKATFWFVVLVSVPGLLYAFLFLTFILSQLAGVSVSQVNDNLAKVGLQPVFATIYVSTVLWAWFGPILVLAGALVTGRASRNRETLPSRLRWMWGLVAVSLGAWLASVLFWRTP